MRGKHSTHYIMSWHPSFFPFCLLYILNCFGFYFIVSTLIFIIFSFQVTFLFPVDLALNLIFCYLSRPVWLFLFYLGGHTVVLRDYSHLRVTWWCSGDHKVPGIKLRDPTCKACSLDIYAISLNCLYP